MLNNLHQTENIDLLARLDFLDLCLIGETGTGKTHTARRIHEMSPRRDQPFIDVNCAELNPLLIEAELFGYEKGAFTGAVSSRDGKFVAASGGTLFLDEIGELPAHLQAKLLKVVEEKQVTPVGGNRPRPVNVRIIFATNRDLSIFREDFRYRITAYTVLLRPLRERSAEIIPLARLFLEDFNRKAGRQISASEKTLELLKSAAWRGNVRELRSFIDNVCIEAIFQAESKNRKQKPVHIAGDLIQKRLSHLEESYPESSAGAFSSGHLPVFRLGEKMEEYIEKIETFLLKYALDIHNDNQSRAARDLGLSRSGLIKKLKRINH